MNTPRPELGSGSGASPTPLPPAHLSHADRAKAFVVKNCLVPQYYERVTSEKLALEFAAVEAAALAQLAPKPPALRSPLFRCGRDRCSVDFPHAHRIQTSGGLEL